MREAVIVSAVRTPVGKAPKGTLRNTRPDDLGAIAVKGALERVPMLDLKQIDDVIIGCAMPEAEQGMNVARIIALRAGLPITSAAMTINRYCASGLQSIALATERIRAEAPRSSSPAARNPCRSFPWAATRSPLIPGLSRTIPAPISPWDSRRSASRSATASAAKSRTSSRTKAIAKPSMPFRPVTSRKKPCPFPSWSPCPTAAPKPPRPSSCLRPTKALAPTPRWKRWPGCGPPSMPGAWSRPGTARRPLTARPPRW